MGGLLGGLTGGGGSNSSPGFTPPVSPQAAGQMVQNQYTDFGMPGSLPEQTDIQGAEANAQLTNLQALQNFNLANMAQQNAAQTAAGSIAGDLSAGTSNSNDPAALGTGTGGLT